MKLAAVIAGICFLYVALPRASAEPRGQCGASPRIVGLLGAENSPAPSISISGEIRAQLPDLVAIRQILETHLAPSGEQIVVYDSSNDEFDPHPKVAFIVDRKVRNILDDVQLVEWGGGFVRFQAACPYDLEPGREAVALAFSTAGDGTGSIFEIVTWQRGTYKLFWSAHAIQGRLAIGHGRLSLWDSRSDGECVWCTQHYTIRHFILRDHIYRKSAATRPKRVFDPNDISGQALKLTR